MTLPFKYVFGPDRYKEGVEREWLVANGIGGFASSTALGAQTRAYHGLLVAAMRPPVERRLLLSSLDEELFSNSHYQLACHRYPGVIHPQGFEYLKEFRLDPFPCFRYEIGDVSLEKRVFMIHGENTTVVSYNISGENIRLRIAPLITCRNFHAVSGRQPFRQELIEGGIHLSSYCDLFLISDLAQYMKHEDWYYSFEYENERQRGLPWMEDLFCPGFFEVFVDGHLDFGIFASTEQRDISDVNSLLSKESKRLNLLEKKSGLEGPTLRLIPAADSFIVKRGRGKSIIAGYHWFNDWGRDAMISLPGLLLVTGRFDEARKVLKTFGGALKGGVLPNDLGAESYNTVDASLWFINSLYKYWRYTGDGNLVRDLWPALQAIIDSYSHETIGARMDSDYLISANPGLTWMDAKVGESFITPRSGKACEINALWYSSLQIMEIFANFLGESWDIDLAKRVKTSYQKFWNDGKGCLYDVVDDNDNYIRPNQIFAVSIPFDLLSSDQQFSVVNVVTRELLTPYGLRTLSRDNPDYIGRYEGSPQERDRAYHQGTVWPWLIGPYISAYVKVNNHSKESKTIAKEMLRPLMEHLDHAGLNTISEIFDGDPPHRPGGCISQAWSVAELMRAWSEDLSH